MIPNAVFTSASEIPVAKAAVSGAPVFANAANALIIPNTVPIRPTKVPIDAMVEIITKFLEILIQKKILALSWLVQKTTLMHC